MIQDRTNQTRRYRNVSDLRRQFQCEYRLYLEQSRGSKVTEKAQQGARLHGVKLYCEESSTGNTGIRVVVAAITILAAVFWILG